jgi:drug/metabolite transporter (DMT)-like permease
MLVVLICCTTGGEIAMTFGMKRIGELEGFHPRSILRFLGRAVQSGWVWLAVPLMAISFYSLLILLSWAPVSLVIPASAFTFVVGTFGAKYLLKENVTPKRWLGVALVFLGVLLVVSTGSKQSPSPRPSSAPLAGSSARTSRLTSPTQTP